MTDNCLYNPFEDEDMIAAFVKENAKAYEAWLIEKGYAPDNAPDAEYEFAISRPDEFLKFAEAFTDQEAE